jgi:hypothetical protein
MGSEVSSRSLFIVKLRVEEKEVIQGLRWLESKFSGILYMVQGRGESLIEVQSLSLRVDNFTRQIDFITEQLPQLYFATVYGVGLKLRHLRKWVDSGGTVVDSTWEMWSSRRFLSRFRKCSQSGCSNWRIEVRDDYDVAVTLDGAGSSVDILILASSSTRNADTTYWACFLCTSSIHY